MPRALAVFSCLHSTVYHWFFFDFELFCFCLFPSQFLFIRALHSSSSCSGQTVIANTLECLFVWTLADGRRLVLWDGFLSANRQSWPGLSVTYTWYDCVRFDYAVSAWRMRNENQHRLQKWPDWFFSIKIWSPEMSKTSLKCHYLCKCPVKTDRNITRKFLTVLFEPIMSPSICTFLYLYGPLW